MSEKLVCPNCGESVEKEDQFCPNCGAALSNSKVPQSEPMSARDQAISKKEDIPVSPNVASQKNPMASEDQVKKPKKKKHTVLAIIIVLILLVGVGFAKGQFTKHRQIQQLAKDTTSLEADTVQKSVVDVAGRDVSAYELRPLTVLYSRHPSERSKVQRAILAQKNTYFKPVNTKSGPLGWFFPRYRVQLKTGKLEIFTDLKNPEFTFPDSYRETIKGTKALKEAEFYPGYYRVEVSGKARGESVSKTLDCSLVLKGAVSDTVFANDLIDEDELEDEDNRTSIYDEDRYDNSNNDVKDDTASDTEDDEDSDTITSGDYFSDKTLRNDVSDTSGLIGSWHSGDLTFYFGSDGTYSGDSNGSQLSGIYEVVYRNGSRLNINFSTDGGQTYVTEPFEFVDGKLIETNLKLRWSPDTD